MNPQLMFLKCNCYFYIKNIVWNKLVSEQHFITGKTGLLRDDYQV